MAEKRQEMKIVRDNSRGCYLHYQKVGFGKHFVQWWHWENFKLCHPALAEGLQPGQTRKLIRTQRKDGFQLQRAN